MNIENKKILTAIVDDHTLFRQGICSILSEYEDIKMVFDVANGSLLKEKMTTAPLPHVILMDISMPQGDGYEATRWLKQNYPTVKVLALSMLEEDEPIIKMLRSGAGGYMLKASSAADLVFAIKSIASQDYFLNNQITGKLIRSLQGDTQTPGMETGLTANEVKFLQLCCSELTYKEIANQMCLSVHTIDNYRDALFQKFDLKSRTGLVLYALKNNIASF
jgi:DNA-binding NarL/FixJ family response regulator